MVFHHPYFPHLMPNESIIIYRSQTEQVMDEYYSQLLNRHPEYALYTSFAIVAVFGVILLWMFLSMARSRREFSRRPRSGWSFPN